MKNLLIWAMFLSILLTGCADKPKLEPWRQKEPVGKDYFDKFLINVKEQNFDEAKENLNKACEMDYSEACYADGQLYLNAKNFTQARERYAKACRLDHPQACSQLGLLELHFKNINSGVAALEKSCTLKDALACANLGKLYSGTDNVIKKDDKKSKIYYAKACEYGIKELSGKPICQRQKAKAKQGPLYVDKRRQI